MALVWPCLPNAEREVDAQSLGLDSRWGQAARAPLRPLNRQDIENLLLIATAKLVLTSTYSTLLRRNARYGKC